MNTLHVISNDPDLREAERPIGDFNQLDELEEMLYVLWEISPLSREWKRDLVAYGRTAFTYYGEDCILLKLENLRYKVCFPNMITPCNK